MNELYINDKNAYETWHVYMDSSSLSALLTPPPAKDYIIEEALLEDGERVLDDRNQGNILFDARDVQIPLCMSAQNEATFFTRYNSFVSELKTGFLNIRIKYLTSTGYAWMQFKCIYRSCPQFTQFRRQMAKIMLRVRECNPTDRSYVPANNSNA